MLLSKSTYIAFKVYILSVHAFLGDQTSDTGEETSTFTADQVNFFICLQLPLTFSNTSYRCCRTHLNNFKTCVSKHLAFNSWDKSTELVTL